jgi:hypothetical protein
MIPLLRYHGRKAGYLTNGLISDEILHIKKSFGFFSLPFFRAAQPSPRETGRIMMHGHLVQPEISAFFFIAHTSPSYQGDAPAV